MYLLYLDYILPLLLTTGNIKLSVSGSVSTTCNKGCTQTGSCAQRRCNTRVSTLSLCSHASGDYQATTINRESAVEQKKVAEFSVACLMFSVERVVCHADSWSRALTFCVTLAAIWCQVQLDYTHMQFSRHLRTWQKKTTYCDSSSVRGTWKMFEKEITDTGKNTITMSCPPKLNFRWGRDSCPGTCITMSKSMRMGAYQS